MWAYGWMENGAVRKGKHCSKAACCSFRDLCSVQRKLFLGCPRGETELSQVGLQAHKRFSQDVCSFQCPECVLISHGDFSVHALAGQMSSGQSCSAMVLVGAGCSARSTVQVFALSLAVPTLPDSLL